MGKCKGMVLADDLHWTPERRLAETSSLGQGPQLDWRSSSLTVEVATDGGSHRHTLP